MFRGASAGLALMLAASAALASDAPSPADDLQGRFSIRFRNGDTFGKTYWSRNTADIVRVDDMHAYVRMSLAFFNGHQCFISAIATAEGAELVYREREKPVLGDTRCVLHITHQGDWLRWNDEEGTCYNYCGMRGSFADGRLPWRSRKPIKHVRAVKSSDDYRDAVQAFWKHEKPEQ